MLLLQNALGPSDQINAASYHIKFRSLCEFDVIKRSNLDSVSHRCD